MKLSGLVIGTVLAVGAVVSTGANALVIYRRVRKPPDVPTATLANWHRFSETGARIGPAKAPLTLVVFNDYRCGACRTLEPVLQRIRRRYGDAVTLVYHQWPRPGDLLSQVAAMSAHCAGIFGRFAQLHQVLFANATLRTDSIVTYAQRAGISDTAAFKACVVSRSASEALSSERQLAQEIGVFGTPTILVNDDEYLGLPYGFEKIVKAKIESVPLAR